MYDPLIEISYFAIELILLSVMAYINIKQEKNKHLQLRQLPETHKNTAKLLHRTIKNQNFQLIQSPISFAEAEMLKKQPSLHRQTKI